MKIADSLQLTLNGLETLDDEMEQFENSPGASGETIARWRTSILGLMARLDADIVDIRERRLEKDPD